MNKFTYVAGATLLALSASLSAEVKINGFANLVVGISDSDTELFGYSDSADFSNESLFALQVSGDVADNLTATAQIVSRGINDYRADFEWAYLTYTATENLSISAGRIRLPLFLYSESLDVGYSYHWITPPNSVYGIAFNNMDGIKANYTGYTGGWDYGFNAAFGVITNPEIDLNSGDFASLKGENTLLLSAEVAKDAFKARVVYGQAKGTLLLDSVDQIIGSFAAFAPEIADLMAFNEDDGKFYGVSLGYDNFDWFIAAEYTLNTNKDTFFPDDAAYYVTLGKRFGKFTPSITWQERDGENDLKFTNELAALPEPVQVAIAPAVLGIQMSQLEKWSNITLGLRYDANTQIALKAELVDYTDDLSPEEDGQIFRLAVNYIF